MLLNGLTSEFQTSFFKKPKDEGHTSPDLIMVWIMLPQNINIMQHTHCWTYVCKWEPVVQVRSILIPTTTEVKNNDSRARSLPQVNCKIRLKSVGLYELFEGSSPLEKCLNIDRLSRQETIGQHFPRNFSKTVTHMKHKHTCLAVISSFVFT